jgi:hypothetical protein
MSSHNIGANTTVISESPGSFERGENNAVPKATFFSRLTEDWWAVIIGGIIITAILLFISCASYQVGKF